MYDRKTRTCGDESCEGCRDVLNMEREITERVMKMTNGELLYLFAGLIEQVGEGIHDYDDPEVAVVKKEILSRMK